MNLIDLGPQWLWLEGDGWVEGTIINNNPPHGLRFLCPKCFKENGGPIGTHSIVVWFQNRGVPDNKPPGPGRWLPSGNDLRFLTLSPSINLGAGVGDGSSHWHGFVTDGKVTDV